MIQIPKVVAAQPVYPHPDEIVAIHQAIVASAGEGGRPDFSQASVAKHVADYYGNQPHPAAPALKVNEYQAYERVAWQLNDRQPTGADVTHAAQTLKQAGISPSEFEQTWSVARPVSNRLLGQDPTIQQIATLKAASPKDIHTYYMDHPYPGYEEVTAGEMVKHYRAAEPIARQYGRTPNHEEVSRFAVAGYTADDMHAHYGESGSA